MRITVQTSLSLILFTSRSRAFCKILSDISNFFLNFIAIFNSFKHVSQIVDGRFLDNTT